MDIPRSLESLSTLIDALEEGDISLDRFRLRERDVIAEGEVVAELRVTVPLDTALSSGDIRVESAGTTGAENLTIGVGPIDGLLPAPFRDYEIAVDGASVADDDRIRLDLSITIPVEATDRFVGDSAVQADSAIPVPFEAYRDDSVPPFDDRPYLEAIYEACDTFDEMRELIDLDVTTETVRRYMIDAGVHQPSTYQTGDAATTVVDEESPPDESDPDDPDVEVVLADGIGIPEGTTIDEFISIVRRSKTLHEVQQSMGLDRHEAYGILEDLNLLDLVVGRLAMESERDVTREEIVDRLRRSAA